MAANLQAFAVEVATNPETADAYKAEIVRVAYAGEKAEIAEQKLLKTYSLKMLEPEIIEPENIKPEIIEPETIEPEIPAEKA